MKKFIAAVMTVSSCGISGETPGVPKISEIDNSKQFQALYWPDQTSSKISQSGPSLWTVNRDALLGERRAQRVGDIFTVVVQIDDRAELVNSSSRSRNATEALGIPSLFGLPQKVEEKLPAGATMENAINLSSSSGFGGQGKISRNERLTLRLAATITESLPNGAFRIEGHQEVRVNSELRELKVTGFIRSLDISRQNEIAYDKIAEARISYGGRGSVSAFQGPRYGQRALDLTSPF